MKQHLRFDKLQALFVSLKITNKVEWKIISNFKLLDKRSKIYFGKNNFSKGLPWSSYEGSAFVGLQYISKFKSLW